MMMDVVIITALKELISLACMWWLFGGNHSYLLPTFFFSFFLSRAPLQFPLLLITHITTAQLPPA